MVRLFLIRRPPSRRAIAGAYGNIVVQPASLLDHAGSASSAFDEDAPDRQFPQNVHRDIHVFSSPTLRTVATNEPDLLKLTEPLVFVKDSIQGMHSFVFVRRKRYQNLLFSVESSTILRFRSRQEDIDVSVPP
jgi:hypothetical protein